MKKICRLARLLCVAGAVLAVAGCGAGKKESIGIAEQFGIAYAPLQIMKEKQLLEKKLPGVEINWKQFGGPTGIREGMLNGDIDFGFMGVAPVLIGIDNGMKWRYAAGLSSNDVAIVTTGEGKKTLRDFTEKDRIAILSPACTQHVMLCMLAGQQLGAPHALDTQLVSMSHPDSVNAAFVGDGDHGPCLHPALYYAGGKRRRQRACHRRGYHRRAVYLHLLCGDGGLLQAAQGVL